jgi:hypothetical protein
LSPQNAGAAKGRISFIRLVSKLINRRFGKGLLRQCNERNGLKIVAMPALALADGSG